MNEQINTVGMSLPVDEKYSSGIAYIAIPADFPRADYIADCYRNFRVSIHSDQDGFMNRVMISKEDLNAIEFPDDYKQLGSPVLYVTTPTNNQPYIVKVYAKDKELGDNYENQFKIGRKYNDSFVEVSGNPKAGFLSIALNSDNDQAQINISLNNKNYNGKLNIQVLGDLNIETTNNVNFNQNESFYSRTFDPDNEDTQTELIQEKESINLKTPKFYINSGAENFILGQKFKQFLTDLLTEISKATTTTAIGQMPLLNAAQIQSYTQKIDDFLSTVGYIDK